MKYIFIVLLIGLLIGCNKEVMLEDYERELVVECYLQPGKPYLLALTESVSYLDTAGVGFISGATVVISHHNTSDTLTENRPGYYLSPNLVPYDYQEEFTLYVRDRQGRIVTGKTKIKPPVNIDSISYLFNDAGKAACLVYFDDPPEKNYYQLYLLYHDDDIFDDAQYNGSSLPFTSPFVLKENDKGSGLLFNINKDYYDYLKSISGAYSANNRPLTEPSIIKPNVQGGLGIFTGFTVIEYKFTVTR